MIVDPPTATEFRDSGVAMLNLAWDYAAQLLRDLDDAKHHDTEDEKAYWAEARRYLATALTLTHQGAEFLLKSRITSVSPFLLIARSPRDWPKGSHRTDTPFAEFRTIDAQDLITVHDTFCAQRLAPSFAQELEALRRKRNSITHTLDRRLEVGVEDVLTSILIVYSNLCPDEYWVHTRAQYLSGHPLTVLHSDDHVNGLTVWEFTLVTEVLQPAAMKRFFNFHKRRKRYICLHCHAASGDMELFPRSSNLGEDKKVTTCFVCSCSEAILRKRCSDPKCPGDLKTTDDEVCLSCGAS